MPQRLISRGEGCDPGAWKNGESRFIDALAVTLFVSATFQTFFCFMPWRFAMLGLLSKRSEQVASKSSLQTVIDADLLARNRDVSRF